MKRIHAIALILLTAGCITTAKMETAVYESKDVVDYFVRELNNHDRYTALPFSRQSLIAFTTNALGEAGVEWNKGSYLMMDTNNGVIKIRNTSENIRIFEATVTFSDLEGWPRIKRIR